MQSRGRPCAPGSQYHAAALSFVLHAQSPFMPTLRGDVRIFMNGDSYWGGGGVDLTIFYVNKPEIVQFHRHWKQICDEFDTSLYPQVSYILFLSWRFHSCFTNPMKSIAN